MVEQPIEIELKGRKFKIGKIDALKQFHVARRVSPILADALPAMKKVQALESSGGMNGLSEEQKLDAAAGVITPFVNGMGKLTDADSEFVLFSLLSCCEVLQETDKFKVWAKISNDKVLMIGDLGLPLMLQLAGRAFMHNLQGFF